MHSNHLIGFVILLSTPVLLEKPQFRSILIQRACAKKPDLEFCGEFSTTTEKTTEKHELIIPPEITSKPTTNETVRPTAGTTVPPKFTANETVESEEVEFTEEEEEPVNKTSGSKETLGSLVRLPKPTKNSDEAGKMDRGEMDNSTVSIEDEKGVLVFVSEYCVIERERFVRTCNGEIKKEDVPFCNTYPSACVSTNGVIPIISYCQRYYRHFPSNCTKHPIDKNYLQFCFAFEQFCLPELHAAVDPKKAKSSLRKCEDVLPEARKVCNPFPSPQDTFNVVRCAQFFTNCKKFVDWQ